MMDLLIKIVIFFVGAFFGIVIAGIFSASSRDEELEYYYNLGKNDARREIENEKTL